jgi:hypothetical protein
MNILFLAAFAAGLDPATPSPTVLGGANAASQEGVAAPAGDIGGIEVVVRPQVSGDLKQGITTYRQEFFTAVRPSTALDMVKWLPGFTFEDTRDLRGIGGVNGNVLIDGKPPTNKTDTLERILSRIPSSQIDRVEMIVGGAPGVDMRGQPVVANVIMKKSQAPQRAAVLTALMDEAGLGPDFLVNTSTNAEGRLVEGSFNVAAVRYYGAGLGTGPWTRYSDRPELRFNSRIDARSGGPLVAFTGAYEAPLLGGRLRLSTSASSRMIHYKEEDMLLESPNVYHLDQILRFRRGELGARFERSVGRRTTVEIQLLRRVNDNRTSETLLRPPLPSTFQEVDKSKEAVARNTIRYKPSAKLTLEGTAEFAYNTLKTISNGSYGVGSAETLLSNLQIRERRVDGGVGATWKPTAEISVVGGLRLEVSRLRSLDGTKLSRQLSYLKPRAIVTWAADGDTQIRFRLEHEVAQLNFFDFVTSSDFQNGVVRVGNPELRPQRSWLKELVLERRFHSGGSIVVTGRTAKLSDVRDVIPLIDTNGATGVIGNVGPGRQIDLIGLITVPLSIAGLKRVTVKAGLTWSKSSYFDPLTGQKHQLPGRPRLVEDFHLTHDIPSWRANWGVDAFGSAKSVQYRPTARMITGANVKVNIFAEYRPSAKTVLRVEVDNVLSGRTSQNTETYDGFRGRDALLYTDFKNIGLGRYGYLRVRRSF